MSEACFVDFYQLLELSPTASPESIEGMFRVHAKRYHPENGSDKDPKRFEQVVLAYQTLRDAEKRPAYDRLRSQQLKDNRELNQGAEATSDDFALRHRMLALFYSQRRRSMKQPGIGIAKLEEVLQVPTEIIEFNLWYFREKGWVQRETSGPLSITAAGVDEIESRELRLAEANARTSAGIFASEETK
jgi:curved DNA-binding protein CbpA